MWVSLANLLSITAITIAEVAGLSNTQKLRAYCVQSSLRDWGIGDWQVTLITYYLLFLSPSSFILGKRE
ncbi:MAG: hypothetical protein QNJ32_26515 [Xenococcaceae cyanobacterium MO_167.B27]|nr:hypothetical protein [Xenococcaceae cyanobacterium MO_167.B27]